MKKVLSLIFVLSSFVAFSQSTTFQGTPNTKLVSRGFNVVDSGLILTAKDTTAWFGLKSDFVRKASNGKMYFFDGTKYTELGSGESTAQTLQSVTDEGNVTNNAIQVTGLSGFNPTAKGAFIVSVDVEGDKVTQVGNNGNVGQSYSLWGEKGFSTTANDTLSFTAEIDKPTHYNFYDNVTSGVRARVAGAAGTLPNDFVTKSQLDSAAGNATIPSLQQVTGVDSVTTHHTRFSQLNITDTTNSKAKLHGDWGALNIERTLTNRDQDYWGISERTFLNGLADSVTGIGGYASIASGGKLDYIKNMDHYTHYQAINYYANSSVNYVEGLAVAGYLENSTIGEWHGATVEFPIEISGVGTNNVGTMYGYRVWNKGAALSATIPKYAFHSADPNYMTLLGGRTFLTGLPSEIVGATDKMLVVDTVSGEVKKVDIGGANLANSNLTQTEYYRNYDGGGNGQLDFSGLEGFNVSTNGGSRLFVSDCVGECEQGARLYSSSIISLEAAGSISITAPEGVSISTNEHVAFLLTDDLTTSRDFKFPDRSGTIALQDTLILSSSNITFSKAGFYSKSGTTGIWELPPASSSAGVRYVVVNKGSGTLTINTTASANEIWEAGMAMNTLAVNASENLIIFSDGATWNILN